MAEDLVLDTAIRDWVLIPLSVVMVLIGILRYFVSKLMRSFQVPDQKVVKEGFAQTSICQIICIFTSISSNTSYCEPEFSFLFLNYRQVVVRARNLRAGANFIPPKAFRARRNYFSNEVCICFSIIYLNWLELLMMFLRSNC